MSKSQREIIEDSRVNLLLIPRVMDNLVKSTSNSTCN